MRIRILLFTLSCLTTLIFIKVISEKFFFDNLYYKKSPEFGYFPSKNFEGLSNANSNATPSRYRDVVKLIKNEKNSASSLKKYTVVLIGDSMFFGTGVREQEQVGVLLEKKLNSLFPAKVITLSLPGDNIIDAYIKYRLAKKTLQPDYFIFSLIGNDLYLNEENEQRYASSITYAEIRKKCALLNEYKNTQTDWAKVSYTELIKEVFLPTFFDTYSNLCFFDTVLNNLDKQDKILFFSFERNILYSPKKILSEPYTFEAMQEWIGYTLNKKIIEHGFPLINSSEHTNYSYIPVSEKENHPSAYMHAMYAEILFSYMNNRLKHEQP